MEKLDEAKLIKILNLMSKAIEENRKILAELKNVSPKITLDECEFQKESDLSYIT